MARPYGLLRAGFPYIKTLGMASLTYFPVDMALGKEDRLYILLRGDYGPNIGIRKYTVDDEDLGFIGTHGTGEGEMKEPISIISDDDENLFVSDEGLHRIISYDREGQYLGAWGQRGSGDGELDRPSGIAFDADGNIYVADTMNHRVQKFNRDGTFLLNWGALGDGEGQLNMPYGVTVDEEGAVYVADWRNDRIQKFTADGEHLLTVGTSGSGNGQLKRPAGVAVDRDGDIYVADRGNDRVQLFNAEGHYVQKFLGDAGLSKVSRANLIVQASTNRLREMADLEPQKYLRRPRSVVVDEDGRMYVADTGCLRLQVYQKDAVALSPDSIAPVRRAPTLEDE